MCILKLSNRIHCFQDMDVFSLLQVQPSTLVTYLTLLESHYPAQNPYHNSVHATDVAQSVNVLLRRPTLKVSLFVFYNPVILPGWMRSHQERAVTGGYNSAL